MKRSLNNLFHLCTIITVPRSESKLIMSYGQLRIGSCLLCACLVMYVCTWGFESRRELKEGGKEGSGSCFMENKKVLSQCMENKIDI